MDRNSDPNQVIDFSLIPKEAAIIAVSAEMPTGQGGTRVDRFEVQADGSLQKWHYCAPPHENTVTPEFPKEWTCPECKVVWTLVVHSFYSTNEHDRDNMSSYNY